MLDIPEPPQSALNDQDLTWDWQLRKLGDGDFERLGYPLGLKAAILVELENVSPASRPCGRALSELPLAVRRFLLMPEADGSKPPKLGIAGMLFAILLPAASSSEQSLSKSSQDLFATGEIFAILAGLTIAVPISLRTAVYDTPPSWDGDAAPPWTLLVLNVSALATVCGLMLCVITACCVSLFALVDVSLESYVRVVHLAGVAATWWSLAVTILLLLLPFSAYHMTGHLAPAIALFVVLEAGYCLIFDFFCRHFATSMPLEMLHMPLWFRAILCATYPPAACVLLGDMEGKYAAHARERAVMLLQRAGFEPPPELSLASPPRTAVV